MILPEPKEYVTITHGFFGAGGEFSCVAYSGGQIVDQEAITTNMTTRDDFGSVTLSSRDEPIDRVELYHVGEIRGDKPGEVCEDKGCYEPYIDEIRACNFR